MSSNNAPKGLEKAFEKIRDLIGQISDKTSKPMDLAGFNKTRGELNKVQENLHAITRLVGNFADLADDVKISFLSDGEKKKLEDATKAMKEYLGLVDQASAKSKALKAAEKTRDKAEASVTSAKNKKSTIESKQTTKSAELEGKRGILKAADVEGANPEKLARYRAEIIKLEADLKDLDVQMTKANEELTSAQSSYDTASENIKNLSKEIKGLETKQLNELKQQATQMGISLEGIKGKRAATQIKMLTTAIDEQKKAILNSVEPAYNAWREDMRGLEGQAKHLGEALDATTEKARAADEVAGQKEAFEAKIKSFLGLQGAAQVLRSALRDAMTTIKELDATMTEMAVVTDLSVGDYWDQLPQYSAQASELGVSINDAYKAATLYYQQGLKSNEVTKISAETLKMARIAGLGAEDATNKMTAALRGFNMELDETSAQKISDVYSELAAITASDVNEISTAMTKTASIASSAGMEFETTAAFLSQIIETTRESAETAGTAMKTVIARFQELKKDPAEIGEIDGEIVDANKIETALRSVGVSLRDAGGQFRDLDDVFLELSSKWDGLDKNTQRYIATIAAGSRQQSRFIAMMSNYARTQELVSAANTSAGASQKQFEKTTESLESKIEKLKNAWHEFTMGIMDSDLVKFGVDVLTKFLEVINKVTKGIGGWGSSISKIGGILTIFKIGKKLFEKIKKPMVSLLASVVAESQKAGTESAKKFGEAAKAEAERQKSAEESREVGGEEGESPKAAPPTAQEELQQKIQAAQQQVSEASGKTRVAAADARKVIAESGRADQVETLDDTDTQLTQLPEVQNYRGAAKAETEARQNLAALQGQNRVQQIQSSVPTALPQASSDASLLGGLSVKAGNMVGAGDFKNARATHNAAKQLREEALLNADGKTSIDGMSEKEKKAQKDITKGKVKKRKENASEIKKLEKKNNSGKASEKEKERLKNLQEEQKNLNKELENYDKLTKESKDLSKETWDSIGEGVSKAGEALTAGGVAVGALGQAFIDAGATEFGESLQGVGSIMTTLGTIMGIVGPLISGLKVAFGGAGTAGVTSGLASTAAWSVVGIIVMAVMAAILIAIAAVLIVMSIINNNSPEKKLEDLSNSAEAASETADQAAESYQNLANALDELEGKYDALDELTRGTEAWNDAVKDINDSVLELIDNYPELAKFVENKEGVLTIDMESDGVQSILRGYEESMVETKNASIAADMKVLKAREDVLYEGLGDEGRLGDESGAYWSNVGASAAVGAGAGALGGASVGPIGAAVGGLIGGIGGFIGGLFNDAGEQVKEQNRGKTDNLAKALASGAIREENGTYVTDLSDEELQEQFGFASSALSGFYKEVGDSTSELKDFGKELLKNEEAIAANYEAMSLNVESMVDYSGMSQEEADAAKNLFDGGIQEAISKQVQEDMKDLDIIDDSGSDSAAYEQMGAADRALFEESVKEIYGKDARVDGTEVTFTNGSGETVTEELIDREDQIKTLMIEKRTTEKAKEAAENSINAIKDINRILGDELGQKLYAKSGGLGLSEDDIKKFAGANGIMDKDEAKAIWNKMTVDAKKAYGSTFETFFTEISEEVNNAHDAIEDSKDRLQEVGFSIEESSEMIKGLSAEAAAGLSKIYEDIANGLKLQGKDTGAVKAIAGSFNEILGKVDADVRDQVTADFAGLDVTNYDELLGFQTRLIYQYDVEAEEARRLTEQLANAALATSDWDSQVHIFGEAHEAAEALNKSLQKTTDLQWKYDQALRAGANTTGELLKELISSYSDNVDKYSEAYAAEQKDLSRLYAQGDKSKTGGLDFRKFASITNDGQITVDYEAFREAAQGQEVTEEEFNEWIEQLQETTDQMDEYKEGAKEELASLQELQESTKESYYELREMAKTAVLTKMQEQIDIQQDALDATREASEQIIGKIQEQITDARQARENEKTEEELANMQNSLAYLSMDTSGANNLQILNAQKALEEKQQAYEDTLIDQSLEKLSQANEEAYDQRERQIAIAQQQLEAFELSNEFQREVDTLTREAMDSDDIMSTTLGLLLSEQQKGMSAEEKGEWEKSIKATKDNAFAFKDTDWDTEFKNIIDKIENIDTGTDVNEFARLMNFNTRANLLSQKGFSTLSYAEFSSSAGSSYGGGKGATSDQYEQYLERMETFSGASGNSSTNTSIAEQRASTLSTVGGSHVMSRTEYNAEVASDIAQGKTPEIGATYEDYINTQWENLAKSSVNSSAGWVSGGFTAWNNGKTGYVGDLKLFQGDKDVIGGVWLGDAVDGTKSKELMTLLRLTYDHENADNKLDADYMTNDKVGGHAQIVLDNNGQAFSYQSGVFKPIYSPRYKVLSKYPASDVNWLKNLSSEKQYKSSVLTPLHNITESREGASNTISISDILKNAAAKARSIRGYKTGGLADFTGPAWLDGTKSRPEYVLNADQTERFFALIDVLGDIDKQRGMATNQEVTIDVDINVESISSDYDVEQMANKIRTIIYEDSMYRNVNNVSLLR